MSGTSHPDGMTLDGDRLQVLRNAEQQYSLWPALQPVPAGWTPVGMSGSKAECSAYVDAQWVDMRPLSLRQVMERPAPDQ